MAEGTKLQLQFDTMSGSRTWTFNYASTSTTEQQVKTLATAMIANGQIFKAKPVALASAKLVTTSEQVFDVN